jgi:hypothetical protein
VHGGAEEFGGVDGAAGSGYGERNVAGFGHRNDYRRRVPAMLQKGVTVILGMKD